MATGRWTGRSLVRPLGPVLAGAGAVTLCIAATLGGAAPGTAGAATLQGVSGRPVLAYVTDNAAGYLSVIDTTTAKVAATIPLSLKPASTCTAAPATCKATRTHPVGITASPNGTTVYVDCSGPATVTGAIDVVDVATDTVTNVIPLPHAGAQSSAISANGDTLYVAVTLTTAVRKGAIDFVDLATDGVSGPYSLSTQFLPKVTDVPSPEGIVVADGGAKLGVITTSTSTPATGIAVLHVYTITGTKPVSPESSTLTTAGYRPLGIAVTPTRPTRGFVVARHEPQSTAGKLIVVNLTTSASLTSLTFTTFAPVNVAVSPNGTTVATTGTGTSGGQLVPATRTGTGNNWTFGTALAFGTTPAGGTGPVGLAFLGGNSLYAANGAGQFVTEFDAVTSKLHTIMLKTAGFPAGTASATSPTPLGIAFGQAAAPPATTTTTTTPPVVPTGAGSGPSGAQLAYTGGDPTPGLALGASLLAAGLGFLGVDAWRRRSVRRPLHRRA